MWLPGGPGVWHAGQLRSGGIKGPCRQSNADKGGEQENEKGSKSEHDIPRGWQESPSSLSLSGSGSRRCPCQAAVSHICRHFPAAQYAGRPCLHLAPMFALQIMPSLVCCFLISVVRCGKIGLRRSRSRVARPDRPDLRQWHLHFFTRPSHRTGVFAACYRSILPYPFHQATEVRPTFVRPPRA